MEGTTRLELAGITQVAVLAIASASHDSHLGCFLNIVLPQYLAIQFPDSIPLLILLFCFILVPRLLRNSSKVPVDHRVPVRAAKTVLMVQTVISILLCDFGFWIQRFGKTSQYGFGLMDLGIGGFIFNFGVFSQRMSPSGAINRLLIQLFLGFIRLLTVKKFNLEVNAAEYGIHWNFYFTMAVLYALALCIKTRFNLLIGLLLLIVHEIFTLFVGDVILSDNRNGIIMMNKEGLFSIPASTGIFLVLGEAGKKLLASGPGKRKLWLLFLFTQLSLTTHMLSSIYSEPSRRLMNLAFTSWVCLYYFGFLTLFSFIISISSLDLSNHALLNFLDRNSLTVFLFSNVLILLFKLIFNLQTLSFTVGTSIFMVYLVTVFVLLPKALSSIKKRKTSFLKK